MSFSEPAETDLLPRSKAKAIEPSNNIMKRLVHLEVLYYVVSGAFQLLYIFRKSRAIVGTLHGLGPDKTTTPNSS